MLEALYAQFHALPQKTRDAVSAPEAIIILEEIEEKYDILLAKFVMQVMVREVPIQSIGSRLIQDYNKSPDEASRIARELIDRFFKPVLGYLTAHRRLSQPTPKIQTSAQQAQPKKVAAISMPKETPATSPEVKQPEAQQVEFSPVKPNAQDVTQRMAIDTPATPQVQSLELTQDIAAFTQEIVRVHQLPVQTQEQFRRLYNLVLSRVKGIRDDQELHDMLISPWNLGGMDFTTGLVQQIQNTIRRQADFIQQLNESSVQIPQKDTYKSMMFVRDEEAPQIIPMQPTQTAQPVFHKPIHDIPAPKIAPISPEEKNTPEEQSTPQMQSYTNPLQQGWKYTQTAAPKKEMLPPRVPAKLPIEVPEPEPQAKPQVVGVPLPQFTKPKLQAQEVKPPQPVLPPKIFPTVRKTILQDSKPQLTDIKTRSTPMGPLEELQSFGLKDLRQLSQDPRQVTQLLKGKFDLLEEESLEAKSKGIQAWKNSALNQLYIEMGQESLVSGESIESITQKRAEQKKPYLTAEEFEAIADFNTSLRF